jgi:hypothetical protein
MYGFSLFVKAGRKLEDRPGSGLCSYVMLSATSEVQNLV